MEKRYDQIHESIVRDVLDVFDTLKDLTDGEIEDLISKHKTTKSMKSIARSSNDLICVFPVAASRDISIEVQCKVAKAIEKNCVAMLQMLFSANQITDAKSGIDYLRHFHTNLNKSADLINMDDVLQISDMLLTDSVDIQEGERASGIVMKAIKEDMMNIDIHLPDDVNGRSISEAFKCLINDKGYYVVIEAESAKELYERDYKGKTGPEIVEDIIKLKSVNKDLKRKNNTSEARQSRKSDSEYFSKQVLSNDYRKANEMQPTLMVINFKTSTPEGYATVDSIIIGVKAKLNPLTSEDIITHVVAEAKDSNWIQKAIKASTREISFFKDFLFAIDKAKIDALSMSRKGSANKMWKVLKRRAIKSRFNRLMARTNDATAITTLVMSQNEVDYIKKNFFIDIADPYNAGIIMNGYNLLGLCIVDEALETVKFMWDTGEDTWEVLSFNSLEKDDKDNTYRKIVNLMTKVV